MTAPPGTDPAAGELAEPAHCAPSTPRTNAEDAVHHAAALMDPIELAELLELAELQTRIDRKYFVPAETFRRFAALLAGQFRVLQIDDRRVFGYESVYFDTPQLTAYRAHLQRRRRRYKIRTRTYTDSGLCLFEVKLEGRRGATVKQRAPHPAEHRGRLTPEALAHLSRALDDSLVGPVPDGLRPTLTTLYHRATFVSAIEGARLTCDVALTCRDGAGEVRDTGTHVLVESKSASCGSAADRLLRDMGVRAVSVSKYCVGVAALNPGVPSNPWHPTLRRYFSWTPPRAA